jgi:hypothetical protein
MSKMLAEIRRIVNEDISIRVSQYDVLFEAITNAIHAKATKITCKLNSADIPANDEGVEIINKKVDTITISDDGEGLNNDNYDSFCKYRTEHKKKLGCKGVGRFVFLKVYENVNYKSELKAEQEERTFKFHLDFETEDIKKTPKEVEKNLTEISFSRLTPSYIDHDKHLDRRIELDLDAIRNKVLLHLIPTLFFFKKEKANIEIEFIDSTTSNSVFITNNDVPDFFEKKFEVTNKENAKFDFTLHHRIEKAQGNLNAFYCANNRSVCEFSDKDFKMSLPYGYSGFLLLEASYLDVHGNNERNDFDIYPVRTDVYSTLSWEMINEKLKGAISDIVKKGVPETQKINKEKIKEIQNERPYLVNYIDEGDIEMAGFIDKKQIIEKAKRKFDIEKEKMLTSAGKDDYSDQELKDAIEIAQNELVSYINDRALVLERLKKLVEKKETVESIIHNLFMQQRTDDDYYCIGKNNLWLLDDRFTSYTYAASDKRITTVLNSIGETEEGVDYLNDKPDLSLFFSHNPDNPERLKSVLIELKPFDYSAKSDRKKFNGLTQLRDYVKAFKAKENINEIFAFLITDVDTKFADRLIDDGYAAMYSLDAPIYHRFYEKLGISMYVVSARTLIIDAEARNKVFLDIIKKQSRLNKFLE